MADGKNTPVEAALFRPLGMRIVRIVVMVGALCAVLAIALQTLFSLRAAQAATGMQLGEIRLTRLPMLSSALWDIEPKLAQVQIDDIAAMPQVGGVTLVTAAGIDMRAGRTPPSPAQADIVLPVMPPAAGSGELGRLYIDFDDDYVVRKVLVDTALTGAFVGLITLLLCVLLIRFLRAEVSIPLQRLLAHVSAMSPDHLGGPYASGRPPRAWKDELDQLAEGFAQLHHGIARYVDERNRAEAALAEQRDQLEAKVAERTRDLEAARDKADQASRGKSEFLANMSHEIRTPINVVAGFTTLALRTELTQKQAGYLGKIDAATQSLLRIIDDLLDFSKIEAGRMDMERIPFRLSEVMDTAVTYVGPLVERKGLELLIKVASDVPPLWIGDPLRLGQVLVNLCSNAIKFTERGEVEVSVSLASRTATHGRLLFAVRDTGIGLTPEQAGRLFQAFTQADTSTTRKFGGTGLGLVICQRLVHLMNGRIWLESETDVGTRFFFEVELGLGEALPAPARLPAETLRRAGSSSAGSRRRGAGARPGRLQGVRLLLVEDNPINQELAKELLEMEGALVRIAANGHIAIKMLAETGMAGFDAVLMDLQMPGMDGYEAAQRIRGMPGNDRLPIIAMTAHAMSEDRDRCLALGMQDHLAKPVNPDLLVSKLVLWIGAGRIANAAAIAAPLRLASTKTVAAGTLPGIDMESVLRRCNGNAGLLQDLLRTFRDHYGDAGQRLRDLCAAGRVKDACMLAHTIKGAAANMSMNDLAAAAAALEQALKKDAQAQTGEVHGSEGR